MPPVVFVHPAGSLIVHVDQLAMSICRGFRNDQLEAGGMLLGHRRGEHFEVLDATTPLPNDIRLPDRFVRQDAGHNKILERRWKKSGGAIDYLGEWHTHPIGSATPSSMDRHEWTILWRKLRVPLACMIFSPGNEGAWLIHDSVTRAHGAAI